MPIFSFQCRQCGSEKRTYVKKGHEIPICSKCKSVMHRTFKVCPSTKVTEKRDKFKNKNIVLNIEQITKKRSKEFFVENCVGDAIEKIAKNFGDKEAILQAKRNGWIDKRTGKVIRKGDLK